VARQLLTKRWIMTSFLVVIGVAVCIRLGFWQLDRLAQRRAFNATVEAQINAPVLDLNQDLPVGQLVQMEYRSVTVQGSYDFSQEIVLRNQAYESQLGVQVYTPLKIAGSDYAVLVGRGWIPYENSTEPARDQYQEPGHITVKGVLRLPVSQAGFGRVANPTLAPGETRLDAWNYIDLARIQQQTSLKLLPVYIQEAPDPAWTKLPYRQLVMPDITEGPHMSYAIQWFSFATILGVGYPFFVRYQLNKTVKQDENGSSLDNE